MVFPLFRYYAFPEHFTLYIYVVTSNLLIILSFRLNLETESLFHKLKARGPIRHPLFRYSCQHSRLGYTGLALFSAQTTLYLSLNLWSSTSYYLLIVVQLLTPSIVHFSSFCF